MIKIQFEKYRSPDIDERELLARKIIVKCWKYNQPVPNFIYRIAGLQRCEKIQNVLYEKKNKKAVKLNEHIN